MARIGRVARGTSFLAQAGYSSLDPKRYTDVLARHDAMGPIIDAFWAAHGLHFQPATFFAAIEPAFLDPPGFVSQSWRLLLEFGHAYHALRLSAIFARGEAALDCRHGPAGAGASSQNKILARHGYVFVSDTEPDLAFLSHARNALGPHRLFCGGDHDHDLYLDRP